MRSSIALLLGLSLACTAPAAASMIAVNARADDADTTLDPADVAGAPGYTQAYWNNADSGGGTFEKLLDDAGLKTTVAFTMGDDFYGGETSATTATPDGRMMRGFQRFHPTHGPLTFSGLNPGETYTVVLYWDHSGGAGTQEDQGVRSDDAGGTGPWITVYEPDGDPDPVEVDYDFESYDACLPGDAVPYTGNYIVFPDLVATGGGAVAIDLAEGSNRRGFSGIQIVGAFVPEPATLALVLAGLGGMGLRRRARGA